MEIFVEYIISLYFLNPNFINNSALSEVYQNNHLTTKVVSSFKSCLEHSQIYHLNRKKNYHIRNRVVSIFKPDFLK